MNCFCSFLEELKTPKRYFEINCPLADPVRNPHLVLGTVRHVAISAKKRLENAMLCSLKIHYKVQLSCSCVKVPKQLLHIKLYSCGLLEFEKKDSTVLLVETFSKNPHQVI